jgi:hypothetical protein
MLLLLLLLCSCSSVSEENLMGSSMSISCVVLELATPMTFSYCWNTVATMWTEVTLGTLVNREHCWLTSLQWTPWIPLLLLFPWLPSWRKYMWYGIKNSSGISMCSPSMNKDIFQGLIHNFLRQVPPD